jgi:HD-GYP domain-containing protein (c-di-GMP phosphodiesterase class II)
VSHPAERPPSARSQTDRAAEKLASEVVVLLHGAARAVRLYPAENAAVRKVLADLTCQADRVLTAERVFDLKRAGDYLFINDTRLRLGFDNLAAVNAVIGLMREAAVGTLSLRASPAHRDWVVLLGLLSRPATALAEPERLAALAAQLEQAAVTVFELGPTNEGLEEVEGEVDERERSRQVYLRTLNVTRDVFSSARVGNTVGVRTARRAVRGVVDQILKEEASILGLTALRDFDEYTFVHSVNVCILSVALGRRLGLTKLQLLDLGLAAVMHDVGKARVPIAILNKRGALTDVEFDEVRQHTWKGVLALLSMPLGGSRPWRAMMVAFEHHLRVDLAGYPRLRRPRHLSLFSRIVAVADSFDAATSKRIYREVPWTPADVLRDMRDTTRHGLDPVVVKAFINMIGVYPLGTVVVLNTGEVGVVVGVPTDPAQSARPVVRLVLAPDGTRIADEVTIDLSLASPDAHSPRTIVRTEDPERYAIVVTDYTT